MAVRVGWAGTGFVPLHRAHIAQLYQEDHEILDNVCAYASDAFRYQHSFLFLGTRAHGLALMDLLGERRLDVRTLTRQGQITLVAAEDVLPKVMRGRHVDDEDFRDVIARLIERAQGNGRFQHVHVFGELGGVLPQRADQSAAVRLEELWNEVRAANPIFTLYCGYRAQNPASGRLPNPMKAAIANHSHLLDATTTSRDAPAPRGILAMLADPTRDDGLFIDGRMQAYARRPPTFMG